MLRYLGVELLESMLAHYVRRYQLAMERGYIDQNSQYYWLFEELRDRILAIRQTEKFLFTMPLFMQQGDEERTLQYVVSYISDMCGEYAATVEGKDGNDNVHLDYVNSPYWKQADEVWNWVQKYYDMNNLPLLYLDLSEYLVRALRFYFYMREQFCPIDRDKFDEIMQLNYSLVGT